MEERIFIYTNIPPEVKSIISTITIVGNLIFTSPQWSGFIKTIKILAAIVSIGFSIGIIFIWIKLNILNLKIQSIKTFIFPNAGFQKEKVSSQWKKIELRLIRGGDSELRLAVIEADQLLDYVLKRMGIPGKTMAERLDKVKPWQIENISEVLIAHKIRNKIIHEPNSHLTPYEAEKAVRIYEKALKSLGAL
jgi:hypothetical protein